MPTGSTVRLATADDVQACAALSFRLLGGDESGWSVTLDRQIAAPDGAVFVAEVRGHVVGHAYIARCEQPVDAPAGAAPPGLYLLGLLVDPDWRRCGLGEALTDSRLAWAWERDSSAYYFANARNRSSIDLHARLGFYELTRDFSFPGATFTGGIGILFRADRPTSSSEPDKTAV